MNRVQISGGLFACILYCQTFVASLLFLPVAIIDAAGQEAWLAILVGGVASLVPVLAGVLVCIRHPRQNAADVAQTLLGRPLGRLWGLVFSAFAIWIFSLDLRDLYDYATEVLLDRTPGAVIVSAIGLIALYGVWQGLEPVARVSFTVVVALVTACVLAFLMITPELSVLQREPFLYHGPFALLRGAWIGAPWFGESVMVLALAPHLKEPARGLRWALVGVGGGILTLATMVLFITLTFGPDLPSRLAYPAFELFQVISLGPALERMEVLLIIVWVSGMFVKLGFSLYAGATVAARTFGRKDHRWTAVLVAVTGLLLTRIWPSALDVIHWGTSGLHSVVHLSVEYGLPLLLLAGSLVHGVSGGRRGASA